MINFGFDGLVDLLGAGNNLSGFGSSAIDDLFLLATGRVDCGQIIGVNLAFFGFEFFFFGLEVEKVETGKKKDD
jgi:hypothetical protein